MSSTRMMDGDSQQNRWQLMYFWCHLVIKGRKIVPRKHGTRGGLGGVKARSEAEKSIIRQRFTQPYKD